MTWTKDGQPLATDGSSLFSFSQTITNRFTSTYSNVLSISESVTGVAGTYVCNVSNDLGSDSVELEAVGEVQCIYICLCDYSLSVCLLS